MARFDGAVDAFIDAGQVPEPAAPSAVVSLIDSSQPEIIREGPLPLSL